MQVHDLPCNPYLANPLSDLHLAMADQQPSSPSPIHSPESSQNNNKNSQGNKSPPRKSSNKAQNDDGVSNNNSKSSVASDNNSLVRKERPSRACTRRAAERMQAAAAAEAAVVAAERRQKKTALRRERLTARLVREELDEEEGGGEEDGEEVEGEDEEQRGSPLGSARNQQCSKIVTPLLGEPEPSKLPRWNIRGMWQLASILNFLNVFRPLLNIKAEFSVEEFETALITPNNTLGEVHIPLLKSIPPITRMALGHSTWITVLCRKLRDWWLWVAEGELPIVASHGAEIEAYNALDPAVRVIILKALCDIRVEQEDIRNYIDNSLKHGVHLSSFRKERIGGDSHGVSYWYEDDPTVGHRLYREIRKVEVKKGKGRNIPPIPNSSFRWETVATNFDEFQDVSEKLFSSKNRTEASVGKKLKNDMLPEIEKVHKKKEKLLKKQHRQALMLDNLMNMDGLATGRSLRDRKPVTYTFDDYDRSINEAIKITKKQQPSPEFITTRREGMRFEAPTNGRWDGPSETMNEFSPKSPDYDGLYEDNGTYQLDRSNRRRQRPQRYSAKEFVEAVSDNEADFDSDDDIVGEVIYDDEYLRKRKQMRKMSSSSEGDDEYHCDDDDDNPEEEEEEEEEDDADSFSASEESDGPRNFKKLPGRTRRETKLRSVDELQLGLRRSKRATRNRIDYRQYELSESETEYMKPRKSNAFAEHSNESENADEFSMASQDSGEIDNQEMKVDQPMEQPGTIKTEKNHVPEKVASPHESEGEGVQERRFLDLNELAPGSGFDDGPNPMMKDEATDDF